MSKRWRIHPHDAACIATIESGATVPAVVAQLLVCRGIRDPEQARRFLDPKLSALREPELLPGCLLAAERIHQALRQGRRIVVYGDYDVDGITGTALLCQCLKLLGGNAGYYVPHRIDEGYGLNPEAVRRLAADKAEMIVSVDCGIGSLAEAAVARECGIELIVTDHHEPGPQLPQAAAIVHPGLPGSCYPFRGLSGSGVAFKLAWAICQQASGAKRVGQAMKDYLVRALGLAALGTVADVVPLVDENRILVRHGLANILQKPSLGLATLLKVAGLAEKRRIDAEDVGFTLGPRLNAAGRLGQAQLAVELLLTDRPERAEELALYVDGLNGSRQKLENSIYLAANKQAKEQFDPDTDAAIVLADHGWHAGVIGIVAGRLAEKYQRPVVLIAWDPLGIKPGHGSARSVPGFNLHAALECCAEHLLSYGGHAAAAGLTIVPGNLDAFRNDFCQVAAGLIADEGRVPELFIDAEAPLSVFSERIVRQIEQLAPFGHSNHRPVLCATGVTLAEPAKPLGSSGRHLAVRLTQHRVTMRAVAFGCGERIAELTPAAGPFEVAFRPMINTFKGRSSVELQLVDWRPCPPP
jgi:single-stranded-DNA-specific exonuclease